MVCKFIILDQGLAETKSYIYLFYLFILSRLFTIKIKIKTYTLQIKFH